MSSKRYTEECKIEAVKQVTTTTHLLRRFTSLQRLLKYQTCNQ